MEDKLDTANSEAQQVINETRKRSWLRLGDTAVPVGILTLSLCVFSALIYGLLRSGSFSAPGIRGLLRNMAAIRGIFYNALVPEGDEFAVVSVLAAIGIALGVSLIDGFSRMDRAEERYKDQADHSDNESTMRDRASERFLDAVSRQQPIVSIQYLFLTFLAVISAILTISCPLHGARSAAVMGCGIVLTSFFILEAWRASVLNAEWSDIRKLVDPSQVEKLIEMKHKARKASTVAVLIADVFTTCCVIAVFCSIAVMNNAVGRAPGRVLLATLILFVLANLMSLFCKVLALRSTASTTADRFVTTVIVSLLVIVFAGTVFGTLPRIVPVKDWLPSLVVLFLAGLVQTVISLFRIWGCFGRGPLKILFASVRDHSRGLRKVSMPRLLGRSILAVGPVWVIVGFSMLIVPRQAPVFMDFLLLLAASVVSLLLWFWPEFALESRSRKVRNGAGCLGVVATWAAYVYVATLDNSFDQIFLVRRVTFVLLWIVICGAWVFLFSTAAVQAETGESKVRWYRSLAILPKMVAEAALSYDAEKLDTDFERLK